MLLRVTTCLIVLSLACGDDDGSMDSGTEDAGRSDTSVMPDGGDDDAGEDDAGPDDDAGESDAGDDDAGPDPDAGPGVDFVEVDGLVSMEAENYTMLVGDDVASWYTFRDGEDDPDVTCATNVSCGPSENRPMCNQYANCDGDSIDPAEASGGAYVEALPDRRRDDSEPGTGGLGFWGTPGAGPTLIFEVEFTNTGRYYVWGRARGQGPAANGIHFGVDGEWPRNDLIDPSTMRMQFPNGWGWTQNRRGGSNHLGVPAGDGVSRRDANMWLEIDTPGVHTIELAMREDGLEMDKIVLVLDPDFEPTGDGPAETR